MSFVRLTQGKGYRRNKNSLVFSYYVSEKIDPINLVQYFESMDKFSRLLRGVSKVLLNGDDWRSLLRDCLGKRNIFTPQGVWWQKNGVKQG